MSYCIESRSLAEVFKIEALIWVSFWRVLKFQPSCWMDGSNPIHQSKNTEMRYKTHIKLVLELCGIPVQCGKVRINHLTIHLMLVMIAKCLWEGSSKAFPRLPFCGTKDAEGLFTYSWPQKAWGRLRGSMFTKWIFLGQRILFYHAYVYIWVIINHNWDNQTIVYQ